MKSEVYLLSRPLVLKNKKLDIELTPIITARLKKKLVVAQLVNKFLTFRLIIVFTKAMYRKLSQCTSSHLLLIRSILILLFHIYVCVFFLSEMHLTSCWIKIFMHFSF